MSRSILLIHYSIIVSVTLYASFHIWVPWHGVKRENRENGQTLLLGWLEEIDEETANMFNLCTPLNGCKMIKGCNLCSTKLQMCFGSPRCCRDCIVQGLSNVSSSIIIQKADGINRNLFSNMSITFEDVHKRVIFVNLSISVILLAAYLIMVVLVGGRPTVVEKGPLRMNEHVSQQHHIKNGTISDVNMRKVLVFSVINSSVLGCVIVIIHTTTYLISNLDMLLKCQATFVLLISWIGLYTLHLLDQLTYILSAFKGKDYRVLLNRNCESPHMGWKQGPPLYWKTNFNYLLSIFSTLLLGWWVFIPIYLYSIKLNGY